MGNKKNPFDDEKWDNLAGFMDFLSGSTVPTKYADHPPKFVDPKPPYDYYDPNDFDHFTLPSDPLADIIQGSKKYFGNRDSKFKDFKGKFSEYWPEGSLQLFYGQDPQLYLFEKAISEFSESELSMRSLYNRRSGTLLDFAEDQLNPGTEVSVGIEELLSTSLAYMRRNWSDLSDYARKGCDIDDSLLETESVLNVLSSASKYQRLLRDPKHFNKISPAKKQADDAKKLIRAFLSIAEYIRFDGDGNKGGLDYFKLPPTNPGPGPAAMEPIGQLVDPHEPTRVRERQRKTCNWE